METPDSTREPPHYMKNIYEANRRMFETKSKTNTDVTINVTNKNDEKNLNDKDGTVDKEPKRYYAHKYIIESRCPTLWASATNCDDGKMSIKIDKVRNLTEFAMDEILKYFYTDHIVLTSKNTFAVLAFSKLYDLPQLEKKCKNYVDENINEKTVCKILEDSIIYDYEKISKSCEAYIASNTKKVLEHENFLIADVKVVHKITTFEKLNVDEIVLFEKCIEWAKKHSTVSTGKDRIEGSDLRKALSENGATKSCYIRFPTMKLIDFNTRVVPIEFLDADETVEIYNYLTAPDNKKPDTPRFNANKRQRTRAPVDPKYAPRSEF